MAEVRAYQDDCRTAEDVRRHAQNVNAKRREFFKRPERPEVQFVYVEAPPTVVEPPIQEMFEKVAATYGLEPEQLSTAIKNFVQTDSTERQGKFIRIHDIQRWVAHRAGISKADLLGQRRQNEVVIPRQIAMALCKRLTTKSYPEIGRQFGNRDHTTILHAVRKMTPLLEHVEKIIRPEAELSEWIGLMFDHHREFIHKA